MSPAVAQAVREAAVPAIAVNDTFRLAPWADVLYAHDPEWWHYHAQDALKFAGLKVTAEDTVPFRSVHYLRETGHTGFDPDPECIRSGGNSGYQAIHIAAHAGARKILVCGMDMTGGHWHGEHPAPLRNTAEVVYEIWRERLAGLSTELAARGIAVVNCGGGKLEAFPRQTINEALRG